MCLKIITVSLMFKFSNTRYLGIISKTTHLSKQKRISIVILINKEPWIDHSISFFMNLIYEYMMIECSKDNIALSDFRAL